jgi:predicted GNAT family acetyltransferase
MELSVHHNPAALRFELPVGGRLGVCSYRQTGHLLVLHHTEVPAALQGQGIAAALVAAALAWARGQGLRVRPDCSYVATYMHRHPDTQTLLESSGDTP